MSVYVVCYNGAPEAVFVPYGTSGEDHAAAYERAFAYMVGRSDHINEPPEGCLGCVPQGVTKDGNVLWIEPHAAR